MNAVTDLVVKVQGAITESNFDAYKAQIINQIKSANKELKTDDDFIEAENTVKQFQAAEKAIVQSKTDALEQAAEVQRMFEAMDEVNEEVRQARLSLQKQIKQRKEQIKTDLVEQYAGFVADHYDELCESSPNFRLVRPNPFDSYDVLLASIKGLKTVKSIESRLIDGSQELKTKLDVLDGGYVANKKTLDFVDEKHKPLFQDEKALLSMDAELLTATIEKRIATHQTEELKRQQAEAEAKAEAERLTAEKVKNEQESAEIKEPTEPANIPTYINSSLPVMAKSRRRDKACFLTSICDLIFGGLSMTEHQHQAALIEWATLSESKHPELRWLYAIPNGGQRHIRVAKKLKAEGVKPGVSDLCLPVARHGFHGFYAELKAPKGKPTKNQTEFIEYLHKQGYHAAVYYGWESVKAALEWYLSGKKTLKVIT